MEKYLKNRKESNEKPSEGPVILQAPPIQENPMIAKKEPIKTDSKEEAEKRKKQMYDEQSKFYLEQLNLIQKEEEEK